MSLKKLLFWHGINRTDHGVKSGEGNDGLGGSLVVSPRGPIPPYS